MDNRNRQGPHLRNRKICPKTNQATSSDLIDPERTTREQEPIDAVIEWLNQNDFSCVGTRCITWNGNTDLVRDRVSVIERYMIECNGNCKGVRYKPKVNSISVYFRVTQPAPVVQIKSIWLSGTDATGTSPAKDLGHHQIYTFTSGLRGYSIAARPPAKGFADLDQARTWAAGFVHWYNVDHRHSGIRYVSPAQRHAGDDHAILAARHALYRRARELNPARWSGNTRNWSPIGAVTLNPERDAVIKTHLASSNDTQPLAA